LVILGADVISLIAMEGHLTKEGLPFRPTLVSMVVALILLGSGTVGALAYASSYAVVEQLWRELSQELASTTTHRTLRYLEPAAPALETTRRLATMGLLSPSDPEALLAYFAAVMEANPSFTWVSHAGEDGRYLAVYRTPGGELRGTWRTVEGDRDGAPSTRFRALERGVDGAFRVTGEELGSYDPRTRDWYRAGRERERGLWVEPFLFATTGEPGFMYVVRDHREGELRGVWAVEFEVSYLSEFLATLDVGENGRVYVVTRDGLVVGHPSGEVTAMSEGEQNIARADAHPDPMLLAAWTELVRLGGGAQSFEAGPYLAMSHPFPEDSGIPWLTLVVVPSEDFFGPLRRQAWTTVAVAALIALLAIVAGVLFANRVSRALLRISDEMGKIGRFELSDERLADRRSFMLEVNIIHHAADAMKRSLRSFGKYVPRELVGELITSGREALLGGEKRELTLLFSDIEGFTSVAEAMDPDDVVSLLGSYFEAASEAIKEQGGTLDKFIGDAVMAFWGAPHPTEDHALRACRAALAMQRRLAELGARWAAEGRAVRFPTRIGINTGLCVVGNIGAPQRMNYTAVGDAVNLASRLEGLSKVYGTTVLIGEETARRVGDRLVLRPLDWVAVKGRQQGLLIHELMGEPADIAPSTREAIDLYRTALDLYRARSFEAAAEGFDEAFRAFGVSDRASEVMAARARAFVETPPDDSWDGTWVATEK
jgi:adenylate cyclase